MFWPRFSFRLYMEHGVIAVSNKINMTQRKIDLSKTVSGVALRFLTGAAFLVISCALALPQQSGDGMGSAGEVLRKAVNSELKAQSNDHSRWMYREKAKYAGKEQVKWVVETREGDLDRLWSVNDRPITREQQKQEDQRIGELLQKPDRRRKRQRAQQEDAQQTERLFKMLPDAATARFGEHKGGLVEILFQPNPNFRPSSHEAAVFHATEGRIWIDEKENRLAEIEGHLIRPVKFYGGLLGHLDEGGTFNVKQSEVAPGHWEVTLLHVNMRGKALFFKTISVQQNAIRSDFRPVPPNITLAQAAEELQRQCKTQAAADNPAEQRSTEFVNTAAQARLH
jgi:actin-related protein